PARTAVAACARAALLAADRETACTGERAAIAVVDAGQAQPIVERDAIAALGRAEAAGTFRRRAHRRFADHDAVDGDRVGQRADARLAAGATVVAVHVAPARVAEVLVDAAVGVVVLTVAALGRDPRSGIRRARGCDET